MNKQNRKKKKLITWIIAGSVAILGIVGLLFLAKYSMDKAALENAEVEFSAELAAGKNTYIEIYSIQPVYKITSMEDYLSPRNIICQCTTESNETVWLYISTDEYKENFDFSADFSGYSFNLFEDNSPQKFNYPNGKTIHGTVVTANKLAADMPEIIGKTLISFESVD